MQVFEEFLKLETRVSIQFLPENFDNLENFIASDLYSPVLQDPMAIELKQQQYKILQEAKRTWLNIYIDALEIKYQEYEHQYQKDLEVFKFNTSTNIHTNGITLFNAVLIYIDHRINRLKQEIYYEQVPIYRKKLIRLHQRLKSTTKAFVNISPKIILDLNHHPFTATELTYLSRG